MTDSLRTRLSAIEPASLRGITRGLEKESLRTTADGKLSMRPHPRALGSALTHPHITTDFSESQVELITGVHDSIDACLAELTRVHQETLTHIDGERLWCTSMPCPLPPDRDIPIGQYGSSFIGRAKTIYRQGLTWRYGSRMQTISGLHYNFSLPQSLWPELARMPGLKLDGSNPKHARSQGYFSLIRNFRHHSWLLLLLFGASPLVQRGFAEGMPHILKAFGRDALGLPHATTLRMGPLGYQSEAQASIGASYNCLKSYAESLYDALTSPWPAYEKIGIRHDGQYRQLSTSLLQIENEFYGTIRPKQPIHKGERPLAALAARGVEYIEVRLMDLDPFSAIGITAETIRFLDIFLLHCLLSDSPRDTPEINAAQSANRHTVAQRGREPGLALLENDGSHRPLLAWGQEVLTECEAVAQRLDEAWPEHQGAYAAALRMARQRLEHMEHTPSARLMADIATQGNGSLTQYTVAQSEAHRQHLLAQPLPADIREAFATMARESFVEQADIEAADTGDFETWRQQYITSVFPLIAD